MPEAAAGWQRSAGRRLVWRQQDYRMYSSGDGDARVGTSDLALQRLTQLAARIAGASTALLTLEENRDSPTAPEALLSSPLPSSEFSADSLPLRFPLRRADGALLGELLLEGPASLVLDEEQHYLVGEIAAQAVALLELRLAETELRRRVEARAEAEASAQWQARHDPLTGLPNRVLFLERLDQALATPPLLEMLEPGDTATRRGRRERSQVAILFLDLNRFKQINDTLGHASGDILLREVAARFAGCLRPEDTLARLGGDEFIVLLPGIPDPKYAATVAQMLLQTLRLPIILSGREFQVGASIGVALSPRDGEDTESLLKHADIAMYQAKATGGFQFYSHTMNADGYRRLLQEGELRQAIEREELTVVYQPQIETQTGRVCSVEALARWRHPEWGQVPPAHFIELAEQADLIVALGECILRQACRDAARWRTTFPEMRLAVNLVNRQVAHPHLVTMIRQILQEAGLSGDALELELTETALLSTGDGTPERLESLRELGARLVVDDFGTGRSSLAFLRRFSVDGLKIDHAFIAGIGRDSRDEALVRAILQIGGALNLDVVAEGVETEPQFQFLENLGCHRMQGYLFSRPVGVEELLTLLGSGGSRGSGR